MAKGSRSCSESSASGTGGEGNTDDPRPARWQEPLAYRSYRSGWSLAARLLETDRLNRAERVTFLVLRPVRCGRSVRVCSVRALAEVEGQRTSIDGWIAHMGQVEEAQRAVGDVRRIDVLLISIGGNDLDFAGTLTDLVRKDSWLLTLGDGDDQEAREKVRTRGLEKLNGTISTDFEELHRVIQARLNPRHLLIAEYPTGLFTDIDTNGRVAKRPRLRHLQQQVRPRYCFGGRRVDPGIGQRTERTDPGQGGAVRLGRR